MFSRMMWACALTGLIPSAVWAVAVVTYESYDDLTPDEPGIVLGAPGMGSDSATIEIWLAPADGEPFHVGGGGYHFEGTGNGGSVTSPDGGITSSDHVWADMFQDAKFWFASNPLPNPEMVGFFPPGEPVPLEGLLMGSLTVSANEIGTWIQPTIPGFGVPLTPESEFYTVTVLPEPTTGALVIGAMLLVLRRRPA